MKSLTVILFICLCFTTFSQEKLKLEEIMKGYDFTGYPPKNHSWSWDGKRIYFEWNPSMESEYSYYYWEEGFSAPKLLPYDQYHELFLNDELQRNKKIIYYVRNGALFCFNTVQKKHEKLIHTSSYISGIIPTKSDEAVYFKQDNNLFLYNRSLGSIEQLTNFKKGHKPALKNSENSFLTDQQKELFVYIDSKHKKKSFKIERDKLLRETFPEAVYYGNKELENLQISPDGKFVLFRLSEYPANMETTVENHLTETGYSKTEKARSKVSIHAISKHELGILNLTTDSVRYVDFSVLSGFSEKPAYLSLYSPNDAKLKTDRQVVMHEAIFDNKSTATLIDIRSQDNKDRWIVNLDLQNGTFDELDHQHDPAWIGGPGISEWNFETATLGFMKNNSLIYFQSEESGFSHLYTLDLGTKQKQQLSEGHWEVRKLSYSKNKDLFYLEANKTHPGNLDYYILNPTNKNMIAVCTKDGAHDVQISPDGEKIAVLYSYKNKPWELFVGSNKPQTELKQLTYSQTEAFRSYPWKNPEVIHFEAKDETKVYARLYEPEKLTKNKAAIIFVHGAGYLQNAHNYWSIYFREFMFHHLLLEKGYTVLDIDYRASDGYGRDFRTGIYRHMGGLDLKDQLDGRQLLIEKYGIDSTRIGIYGGSYGGFITLMALLTHPGKFRCGAALRSVTDWAHYNLEYTSNILNFPETDPDAYRKSSPIYFAQNLQDQLLMLHGMVDDNVQFQDIVRLTERFIELGKKKWDLAVYPVEAHGFKETYSWTDEYRRILELFENHLTK